MSQVDGLTQAASAAKTAEARGDDPVAAREWRRYRLIKDASRDPDELLNEGVALSVAALALRRADPVNERADPEAAHGELPTAGS